MENVTFPLYKLRHYLSIKQNPLGLVKIKTVKNTYILDDRSIQDSFAARRVLLHSKHPNESIYPLTEKVLYLRQLVKYKSGSTFVDSAGEIFTYQKMNKLHNVHSHKIDRKTFVDNWTILFLDGQEFPFLVGTRNLDKVTHASIMDTPWGPFLYDLTSKYHKPYKRKI